MHCSYLSSFARGPPLYLQGVRQMYALSSLAPHTSGPRDVPRCGALSLLQKTPHYRGDPAETAARLNVKLSVLVTDWCVTERLASDPIFSPNPLVE
jgi:hypothetical protein